MYIKDFKKLLLGLMNTESLVTKGIILAGGNGSRLYPITLSTSKQLLNIFDKPMIYYPLTTLMMYGIRNILIIVKENNIEAFRELLGNGNHLGINITYKVQPKPEGIAQAFLIGEEFIDRDPVALILGDNFYYGKDLFNQLNQVFNKKEGGTVFAYRVSDPERYGVPEFDINGKVLKILEKPSKPKSNYAITGLYFYDSEVVDIVKTLKPSKRGELEITDLLKIYLKKKNFTSDVLGRGGAWLDTGSIEDFYKTSAFVSAIENRQGFKIACLEEIAFNNNWIGKKEILAAIQFYGKCDYTNYLKKLIS